MLAGNINVLVVTIIYGNVPLFMTNPLMVLYMCTSLLETVLDVQSYSSSVHESLHMDDCTAFYCS